MTTAIEHSVEPAQSLTTRLWQYSHVGRPVRRLPELIVDQIAAGEVVERPASAVRELVENAIDARATSIAVSVSRGGRALVRVLDNGVGMSKEDLQLSIAHHATSKIPENHELAIDSFGFRGEALPAIGAVSHLQISSRLQTSDQGWSIHVRFGDRSALEPTVLDPGTLVEIRQLFLNLPARAKFLKAESTELRMIVSTLRRLAIAWPEIGWKLIADGKERFNFQRKSSDVDGQWARVSSVLGSEFEQRAIALSAEGEDLALSGFAAEPHVHKRGSDGIYLFVNRRPIADKGITGAIRAAYGDRIPRGRHPMAVIFLEIEPTRVDVNVHPAKSEVRFRDPGKLRSFVVQTVKNALATSFLNSTPSNSTRVLRQQQTHTASESSVQIAYTLPGSDQAIPAHTPADRAPSGELPDQNTSRGFSEPSAVFSHTGGPWAGNPVEPLPVHPDPATEFAPKNASTNTVIPFSSKEKRSPDDPSHDHVDSIPPAGHLGNAFAQLFSGFLLSATDDQLLIVDQHAAHERLVYETLKTQFHAGKIEIQQLLIPEVVALDGETVSDLVSINAHLRALGISLEPFGTDAVLVRGSPRLIETGKIPELIRDIAVSMKNEHTQVEDPVWEELDKIAAKMACYGSIRFGKTLNRTEMNAMLRAMESCPESGQCCHGRPTFITLSRSDLESLFSRS